MVLMREQAVECTTRPEPLALQVTFCADASMADHLVSNASKDQSWILVWPSPALACRPEASLERYTSIMRIHDIAFSKTWYHDPERRSLAT